MNDPERVDIDPTDNPWVAIATRPSPEEVVELGTDLLEHVAGGSDGSAVGHN